MSLHRIQCAAITRGCLSAIVWDDAAVVGVGEQTGMERLLSLNGWHLNYGEWVCGNHERRATQVGGGE